GEVTSGVRSATPARRCAAASTSAAVGKAASGFCGIPRNRTAASPIQQEQSVFRRSGLPVRRRKRVKSNESRRDFRLVLVKWKFRLVRRRLQRLGPEQQLELAVEVLADGAAGLHPIAAIDVADAELVVDHGMMDVPADDPVGGMAIRLLGQGL